MSCTTHTSQHLSPQGKGCEQSLQVLEVTDESSTILSNNLGLELFKDAKASPQNALYPKQ